MENCWLGESEVDSDWRPVLYLEQMFAFRTKKRSWENRRWQERRFSFSGTTVVIANLLRLDMTRRLTCEFVRTNVATGQRQTDGNDSGGHCRTATRTPYDAARVVNGQRSRANTNSTTRYGVEIQHPPSHSARHSHYAILNCMMLLNPNILTT